MVDIEVVVDEEEERALRMEGQGEALVDGENGVGIQQQVRDMKDRVRSMALGDINSLPRAGCRIIRDIQLRNNSNYGRMDSIHIHIPFSNNSIPT